MIIVKYINISTLKQIVVLACAVALCACSSENESGGIGVFVVSRNADGSANALKTSGNYIDNSMYTLHGTWTSAVPEYWKDTTTHADFYMYYPYTATITSVEAMPWSVKTDQSEVSDYKAVVNLAK